MDPKTSYPNFRKAPYLDRSPTGGGRWASRSPSYLSRVSRRGSERPTPWTELCFVRVAEGFVQSVGFRAWELQGS